MKHTPPFDAEYLRSRLSYDPNTGLFYRRTPWGSQPIGSVPGGLSPQGYWQIGVKCRTYPAHRLAWLHVHGVWPPDLIDHINRDRSDNRITNLRLAGRSLNALNADRAGGASGVVGVCKRSPSNIAKGCGDRIWRAYITVGGRNRTLGNYATVEEAAAARKAAERQHT